MGGHGECGGEEDEVDPGVVPGCYRYVVGDVGLRREERWRFAVFEVGGHEARGVHGPEVGCAVGKHVETEQGVGFFWDGLRWVWGGLLVVE